MANTGWDEFEIGAMLRSFDGKIEDIAGTRQEDRAYSQSNSFSASVADWRIEKPIFAKDYCIDCQFCWIYCPDISIISKDKRWLVLITTTAKVVEFVLRFALQIQNHYLCLVRIHHLKMHSLLGQRKRKKRQQYVEDTNGRF